MNTKQEEANKDHLHFIPTQDGDTICIDLLRDHEDHVWGFGWYTLRVQNSGFVPLLPSVEELRRGIL